ncbi:MAG TPA: protein kinase [Myxococcaceae bacterium]|nr:protein kinase [Myxococcaceae bacterium]
MPTSDDQDPDSESGLYSTWIHKVAEASTSRQKLLDQLDAILPHPGDKIGAEDRFEIVERLGMGGMSVVFRARDRRLHRDVAVKFLLSSPTQNDRTAALLSNEARAVARLNHENIVSIFDISTWSGIPFIVMELVDGKPLDLLLGERTPVGRATAILLEIARGVRHAHERGIIHRDLKPSNIFIRADGKPKVLDFGLVWFDAGFSDGGEAWTPDLLLLAAGTPTYMSPEQWRGLSQDACTDIWALGMVYYALLTGGPLYKGAATIDVRELTIAPEPVPLPDAASLGVPEEVLAIIRRALQKRPEDRFQTVAEMIAALEHVQQVALGSTAPAPRQRALPAERRQVTVVCCVMGRPASADEAGEDVDAVGGAHRAFHRICEDAVSRANGRVLSSTGGKLLACFGYPVAHEDDAQRAVRAAMSVTAQVRTLQRELFGGGVPWAHVGVHTGQAIVGGGDDWGSGVTAIQGEVPRVAEEIAAVAGQHQVLVSPRVKKLLGNAFATSEVVPGKGFQAAPVLHWVERETFTESRFEVSSPSHQSLVGRSGELERLRALWAGAYSARGSFVLVEGDAGIGKSRLVHAVKKEVASQEASHLTCQAWPHFANSALMPFIALLSRSMGILREQPPQARLEKLEQGLAGLGLPLAEHVPVLASLLGIPTQPRYPPIPAAASPAQVKAKTFQSMSALLFRMTEQRPVLLVVEDLHWIDPSTLEFLNVIFERVPSARMLVMLTYRPSFKPPWREAPHLHHVGLERFSQSEAAALVETLSRGSLPREVVQTLVAGTDGIPLFIEELTRTVIDAGAANQRSAEGPIAVPASLNELLLARLDVLGRSEREVLQMAAVLGRSFDRAMIRRAAQLADKTLADTLDRLVDQGFLVSWEEEHEHGERVRNYSFKHALIQAAAYHSLVRAQRQQYHAIVATLLQEQLEEQVELQPELLAHHFAEAGDAMRALDYWEKAGHLAARRSANHEAEHHFGNALKLLRAHPLAAQMAKRELQLLIAMGASVMATRGYASAEVRDTYGRARELCKDAGGSKELVTALLGIWQSHMSTGRILTSLEVAKDLAGLAEGLDGSEALVPAYRALGTSHFLKGDLKTALEHIQHSIQVHDRVAHRGAALIYGQDHGVIARLYAGWTFQLLGLPERALASAEEALSLARELGHAHSLVFAECYAMMVMQQRGDYERIRDLAPKTLASCEEHRFALWVGWATVERGYAAARLGGGKEAIADIRAGIEAWRKTGAISGQTYLLPLLADALRRAGRIPEAQEVIGESRALIERTEERMNDANVALVQAEIALERDPPDRGEAERWFRHGLDVARAQGAMSPELRLCSARYRWARGPEERKELEAVFSKFQEGFETEDLRAARKLLEG